MASKPDRLRLVTSDFKTPAQRAAARELLLLWPTIKNFAEISRRTGWSEPHLRAVYDRYFEGAESADEASKASEADVIEHNNPYEGTEAYREGYRDGYQDGLEDAEDS